MNANIQPIPATDVVIEKRWLTPAQTAIVAANGLFLWLVGVLAIRWIGPLGGLGDGWTPLVYACVVLVSIPAVAVTPRLVGLGRDHRLICACVMATTAATLDGIVVRWLPFVYADQPQRLAEAAASLLFAIGVLVALGMALSLPIRVRPS